MSDRFPHPDHAARLTRVRLALDGLSLGDSFGLHFHAPELWRSEFNSRELPPPPWKYTDDTEMALAIADVLAEFGTIEQDQLAAGFARRFGLNPYRGYGSGAIEVLQAIEAGRSCAKRRVDCLTVKARSATARRCGRHPSGRISPAISQKSPYRHAGRPKSRTRIPTVLPAESPLPSRLPGPRTIPGADTAAAAELFERILAHTPQSPTKCGIERASRLPQDAWEYHAAEQLGCGHNVRSDDTVPFCLWVAARHLDDFTEALWTAARVGGDADTTCAIIGGIVALAVGAEGLPAIGSFAAKNSG